MFVAVSIKFSRAYSGHQTEHHLGSVGSSTGFKLKRYFPSDLTPGARRVSPRVLASWFIVACGLSLIWRSGNSQGNEGVLKWERAVLQPDLVLPLTKTRLHDLVLKLGTDNVASLEQQHFSSMCKSGNVEDAVLRGHQSSKPGAQLKCHWISQGKRVRYPYEYLGMYL